MKLFEVNEPPGSPTAFVVMFLFYQWKKQAEITLAGEFQQSIYWRAALHGSHRGLKARRLGSGCRESCKDNSTCIWGCLLRKHPPSRRPPEAGGTPALCPSQREETKINEVVNGHRTLLKHKDLAPKTDNQIGLVRVRLAFALACILWMIRRSILKHTSSRCTANH